MNLKSKRKFRLRTRFFVPAVFILAIALVTLLFPRQGDFKYSFSEGRPWQYGLLTAPFDFPIYKPADQLNSIALRTIKIIEKHGESIAFLLENQMALSAPSSRPTPIYLKSTNFEDMSFNCSLKAS